MTPNHRARRLLILNGLKRGMTPNLKRIAPTKAV